MEPSIFVDVLIYGGLPAFGLLLMVYLFKSVLGMNIFPKLTQKQAFILILTLIGSLVAAALVLSFGFGNDQQKHENSIRYSGFVKDEKNRFVADAEVYAILDRNNQPDTVWSKPAFTGTDGKFLLIIQEVQPPVDVQLIIQKKGYEGLRLTERLHSNSDKRYTLTTSDDRNDTNPADLQASVSFQVKGLSKSLLQRLNNEISRLNPLLRPQNFNADHTIKFVHSNGGVKKTADGFYRYATGHLLVKIDQQNCAELSDLHISGYADEFGDPDGTMVRKQLNRKIARALASADIQALAQTISICLASYL